MKDYLYDVICELLHVEEGQTNKLIDLEARDISKTFYLKSDEYEALGEKMLSIIKEKIGRPGNVVLKNSSGRNDLLGKYVEGYYKEINGIDVLLYAFDSGKYVTFNAHDIKTGNDKLYEVYDENGRIKNYHLKKDFKVLYNGASISIGSGVTKAEFEKMLAPEFGTVTLASTGNNSYDNKKL